MSFSIKIPFSVGAGAIPCFEVIPFHKSYIYPMGDAQFFSKINFYNNRLNGIRYA